VAEGAYAIRHSLGLGDDASAEETAAAHGWMVESPVADAWSAEGPASRPWSGEGPASQPWSPEASWTAESPVSPASPPDAVGSATQRIGAARTGGSRRAPKRSRGLLGPVVLAGATAAVLIGVGVFTVGALWKGPDHTKLLDGNRVQQVGRTTPTRHVRAPHLGEPTDRPVPSGSTFERTTPSPTPSSTKSSAAAPKPTRTRRTPKPTPTTQTAEPPSTSLTPTPDDSPTG
jgi:hypothetical protein